MNLLFLRGDFDKNNQKSLKKDTDMWVQLWLELVGCDYGVIWYKGRNKLLGYDNQTVFVQKKFPVCEIDTIFSRGGFDYYVPAMEYYKNAYKIYYGAGARIRPKNNIKYDLVLVDSLLQKEQLKPYCNAHLWIKPAANHFKPQDVDKEYDICYIANPASKKQAMFKRVKWVYETLPKELRILHLGNPGKYKPPKNVTVMMVGREDMPHWINKCRLGICPYINYDSAPRALVEMNACGLAVVCLEVNIWHEVYNTVMASKETFWDITKAILSEQLPIADKPTYVYTVKYAAEYLRRLICKK